MNLHGEGLLPTCSFVLTARLTAKANVRGETCDLCGTKGALSVQAVDGSKTEMNPFNLGLKIDYRWQKMTIDGFLKQAPLN